MASKFCCKICSESFSQPRLLPCLHVFCKDCLEPLYYQDEGTITCPTCNKTSSCKPPAQLPRHLKIEKEMTLASMQYNPEETLCTGCDNDNKAEAYCEDCSTPICSDCNSSHKQMSRIFNKHSVVHLSQTVKVKTVSCIIHAEKAIKYYCNDCSTLICSKCLFDHKEHEWGPITDTELIKKGKDELQSVLPVMQVAIAPIAKATENITEITNSIQVEKDRAKGEINEAFEIVVDAIENRRVELIQEVDNTAIAKTTQLEIQKEGFDKITTGLQFTFESGSVACNEYNSDDFLAVKASISKASNELLEESRSIDLLPVSNSSIHIVINDTQLMESISSLGNVITTISPYPPHCSILDINPDLAIGTAMDSESVVILQTRDRNGVELTQGTANNVMATVTDPSSESEAAGKCIVTNLDNGRYEISFSVPTEGYYHLNIAIDGTSIDPFNIKVIDYTAIKNSVKSADKIVCPTFISATYDNQYYVSCDKGIQVYDSNMNKVKKIIIKNYDSNKRLCDIALDYHNSVMFVSSSTEIMKVTLDGRIIAKADRSGTSEHVFHQGLCLTRDGLLLVAESNHNKRVQVLLRSDLSFVRFISCRTEVYGVSVDYNGNIHAAATDRVKVFSITGKKITEYGQAVLGLATDVAFLPNSKCQYSFVADHTSLRIFDWPNNTVIHTFSEGWSFAFGVTIDQEGAVIVCDFKDKTIVKLLF